jgi:uncharacterized protein YcbK (DUF882 family)
MTRLSRFFDSAEFADSRTGHELGPPPALVHVLENIRALRPGPLVIVSGHRCPETNRAVGGAKYSRHVQGDAADIGMGRATTAEAEAAGAVGIGSLDGWAVHVDVRPGGSARWEY